jgi:TATA-box binding protein (TBP) (component of TFIID and TFIIIB)
MLNNRYKTKMDQNIQQKLVGQDEATNFSCEVKNDTSQQKLATKIDSKKINFKKYDPSILPEGLTISTMTITGRFDTVFNLENISKYLRLRKNAIVGVKHHLINRAIIIPNKKKKEKKGKIGFFNQATVLAQIAKDKSINIKVFRNGAIQMTGCRSTDDCNKAVSILCNELKRIRAIYLPKENKIVEKPFVSIPENLSVDKAYKFNIVMINSNINLGFTVNRDNLYQVLLNGDADCRYDPVKHASVDIKYNYKDIKKISIFVFEGGCVMITGANTCKQIRMAYDYIIRIIYKNYNKIKNVSGKENIMTYFGGNNGDIDLNGLILEI